MTKQVPVIVIKKLWHYQFLLENIMKKLYLFVIFLVMYEFSTYISNDMIMPGMLRVVTEFHASINFVSLSLTIFILGNSLLQLCLGPLSEYFGKRRVILVGNLLFLVFTFFLVMSHSIYEFMLGRLLQGSGLAFIAIGYGVIHEKFNDKQAVKIFALMGNVSLLAPLLGPVAGALIINSYGWRYIFVITSAIALISLAGLYLFTPKSTTPQVNLNLLKIGKTYLKIVCTPVFIIGALCSSLAMLPIMCWIGLAPTIIMQTMKLSMLHYATYQLISVGGLALSTVVLNIVAGKLGFYRLIQIGSTIAFTGLSASLIFHTDLNMVVSGMLLYSFGLGIFNTIIMRLVMTTPNLPQAILPSLMVFTQTTIFAIGIELANHICGKYNYSLYSFTVLSFSIAIMFLVLANLYARLNQYRAWK